MKITLDQLLQWGICDPDRYAAYVGDGIELTPEAIIAADAADVLDPNWLAPRVLTSERLAAYNAKEATALVVFNAVFTPEIRAEYNRLCSALQGAENDYRAATVQALVEGVKE